MPTLERAVLPKDGTFYAKFRRVTRDALMIRRTRRRCAPRAQRGHGIKNVLRAGFKLAKKLATSNIGRQLGKDAIENAPWAKQAGVSQVKNKRLKKILQSDIGNSALGMGDAHANNK